MWLALRKYRPALMGWLWFIGLLLPVSGLFQFGRQATADRYMYLPLIGILIFLVWMVADALENQADLERSDPPVWRRAVVGLISLFALLLLSQASRAQCQTWRDDLQPLAPS